MAKAIQDTGKYNRKTTGEVISYEYEYNIYSDVDDALEGLGDDKVLSLINRMSKVDSNNTTREKTKVANGDSERKPMTAEEKARNKAKRQLEKNALAKLKSLDADALARLGIDLG